MDFVHLDDEVLAALVLVMAFAAVLALVSRAGTRQSVVAAEQSPPPAVGTAYLPRCLARMQTAFQTKAANAKTNTYGIACIDLAQEKGGPMFNFTTICESVKRHWVAIVC